MLQESIECECLYVYSIKGCYSAGTIFTPPYRRSCPWYQCYKTPECVCLFTSACTSWKGHLFTGDHFYTNLNRRNCLMLHQTVLLHSIAHYTILFVYLFIVCGFSFVSWKGHLFPRDHLCPALNGRNCPLHVLQWYKTVWMWLFTCRHIKDTYSVIHQGPFHLSL